MLTFLVPTGHLGFTPFETESFEIGLKRRPDYVVADSGSCDIGPYPLGSDRPHSPRAWQRQDLEHMLLAARRLGVPMIVGSAGDTGSDAAVTVFAEMAWSIARQHDLDPFRLATIRSQIEPAKLRRLMAEGVPITGLDGLPDATPELLRRTDRAVAVMGAEPIIEALRRGADVVIAGRACDSALCAAPALLAGIPPAQAWYLGKVLECASFCAEPFGGKESVLGTVSERTVVVEAMHPGQRCTPLSLASHAMYERVDPFFDQVPGGTLDMSDLRYRQLHERSTEVTGMRWRQGDYRVKLEGAGKVGERAVAVMGVRDPITLGYLDQAIEWARGKVAERLGPPGEHHTYQLFYHVFGRDGVMGYLEPAPQIGHEVAVVVEAVADEAELAHEVCALGSRNLFYARLPIVKGTAGNASFWSDEILAARPGYTWTLNHLVPVDDPLDLFTITVEEVAVGAKEAAG